MTVLDHLAIGTGTLADGWDLFAGVLGGTWAYGGPSAGFWFGQVAFPSGPKIEMITPTSGPAGAFLERFLARGGPGAHHYNFATSDIRETLSRVAELGIEPVGVNLKDAGWQEAFLHPRDAHGIVIQVAQGGGGSHPPRPDGFPEPAAAAAAFSVIEHHVTDLDRAIRLFRDVLDGEVAASDATGAELTWPGGCRVRLLRKSGRDLPTGGALHHVTFTRAGGFTGPEHDRAALLAKRLGITLDLAGS
jgi:methylmalonyl-CoA/ethylmalonyl-CoA epimerase